MKKIIIINLVSLFVSNIQAQKVQGTVIYKKENLSLKYTKDKKKHLSETKLKKFAEMEKSINKANKVLAYDLVFNNEESTFEVQPFMESPDQRFLKFALGPEVKGVFYTSKKERFRKMNTFGEDFLIYYPKLKWELKNETKKIGNYLAYKATTVEKVLTSGKPKIYLITAWYCPNINAPFGPIGFSGLPGLILELEKNKMRYYASKIELNPKKAVKVKKPTKGKKITMLEYNEMAINAMGKYKKIRG